MNFTKKQLKDSQGTKPRTWDFEAAAKKRRDTMIKKHGSYEAYLEHQRNAARKGGKKQVPTKGFGSNKELASEAGKIGGAKSRKDNVNIAGTGLGYEKVESDTR